MPTQGLGSRQCWQRRALSAKLGEEADLGGRGAAVRANQSPSGGVPEKTILKTQLSAASSVVSVRFAASRRRLITSGSVRRCRCGRRGFSQSSDRQLCVSRFRPNVKSRLGFSRRRSISLLQRCELRHNRRARCRPSRPGGVIAAIIAFTQVPAAAFACSG